MPRAYPGQETPETSKPTQATIFTLGGEINVFAGQGRLYDAQPAEKDPVDALGPGLCGRARAVQLCA
jgi:hypothetical protein